MRGVEVRATEAYRDQFGTTPAVVASAPGRINLIGEHTDYNGGFVLPCAIDLRVACALGEGEGQLYSADFREVKGVGNQREGTWPDYPSGVFRAIGDGKAGGVQAAFAGDVPVGSGLSSSAAIEAATALALDAFHGLGLSRQELALRCQRAENEFVGVSSGVMDQYASLLAEEGAALFIDCRSLKSRPVALPLREHGLELVVCDTGVKRGLKDTEYNERRESCEAAAKRLGVSTLRDASEGDLDRLEGVLLKRARHVVTENERVLLSVKALENQDFAAFGELMLASHSSLRNNFEVSTIELDSFVDAAMASGALGARLTGAGFGGCAIALVHEGNAQLAEERVLRTFQESGFAKPRFYRFEAAPGADFLDLDDRR